MLKPEATKSQRGRHGRVRGGKVVVLTRGGPPEGSAEPTTRVARRG